MAEAEEKAKDQIIKLLETTDMPQKEIAKQLGVSEAYVSQVADKISVPEEAEPYLTKEEAQFIQDATPTQLKRRATELMLETKGVKTRGGKIIREAPSAERPPRRSFGDRLADEMERFTEIQVAAKKFGVDPQSLMAYGVSAAGTSEQGLGGGLGTDTYMDKMLADTFKQYRLQWLQKQMEELRNPSSSGSKLELPAIMHKSLSADEVRSIIKEEIGTRDAEAEKERLRSELAELKHRNELLDQFIRESREREKELAGKPQTDVQTLTSLWDAKTDARIAQLEKDFLGSKMTQLESKITQLESAPRSRGLMDIVGEKLQGPLEERIGDMISKGLLAKEEVVEPKTGKLNWGKVIDKLVSMGERVATKAMEAPPPERRIIALQPGAPGVPGIPAPVAGYQPPQPKTSTEQPAATIVEATPTTNPGEGPRTVQLNYGVETVSQGQGKAAGSKRPEPQEAQGSRILPETDRSRPGRATRKPKPRKES